MTLHQALRDYHTRSTQRPAESVRGLRHIQCQDGAADHFVGAQTRHQYFRLLKNGSVFWLEVVTV